MILGERLNLIEVLPEALANTAAAMRMGNFKQAAQSHPDVIRAARDDVVNALGTAKSLYSALHWIYGRKALGLRFAAWLADHAPGAMIDMMALGMIYLRQVPNAAISSDDIRRSAIEARRVQLKSEQMNHLWLTDKSFQTVFSPDRIQRAFENQASLSKWNLEVDAVIKDRHLFKI